MGVLVSMLAWCAESAVVDYVESNHGDKIRSATKGRAQDVSTFVRHRIHDGQLILTAFLVLLVCFGIIIRLQSRFRHPWIQTAFASLFAFVGINILVSIAMSTALFWMMLYACNPTFKETSFHIERMLLAESKAEIKVALIGSSQAASELDAGILTSEMYPRASFGMLHFAGANASDFLVFFDYLKQADAKQVVCYLSEQTFYTSSSGHTYLPLLTRRAFADLKSCGIDSETNWQSIRYGNLAILLPSFRARRACTTALYGEIGEDGIQVPGRHATSESDDQELAREAAKYQLGANTRFQKDCFQLFLQRCKESNIRVRVIKGQINPRLETQLDADVREDFVEFMEQIESMSSEPLLPEEAMQTHGVADYSDWMHITKSAQKINTRHFAEILKHELDFHRNDDEKN